MSRELLKQALEQLKAKSHPPEALIAEIEAELAKPDEPFGYIGGAWARIAANGGAWDSITVSREKLDESDCTLYANPPRQAEIEAELEKPDDPVGWHCVACHSVGMLHCVDPAECGSMQRTYLQPPRKQEPLSKPYPLSFYHGSTGDYINGFEDGVAWAEDQHGIGGGE